MNRLRNIFVLSLLTVLSILYVSPFVYATENDTVSSGQELVHWMESHKTSGGTVRLTSDITLQDTWYFAPDRPGRPPMTVDTAGFVITVTGAIDFQSDNHLTFCGAPEGNEIFHVAAGGMLTLTGLTVRSGADPMALEYREGSVLLQEEGAGLVVDNCSVSGNIRYAQTPFVMYKSSVTVIAEVGQEASDVLPSVITGRVNWQGQVFYREDIPVSWNLAGTEKLQQGRCRLTVQGAFQGAAASELPECTVAYNDFPLTFTQVEASVSRSIYSFRGSYTKPEEFPIMLSKEYSFDNKNWAVYGVESVSDAGTGFFIGLTTQEWDISVNPYVYIRLRGEHDGTEFYSNVLRYTADDLSQAEDFGGNRGGGTAIVNPPEEPASVPEKTPVPIPEETSVPIPDGNLKYNSTSLDVNSEDVTKPKSAGNGNQEDKKILSWIPLKAVGFWQGKIIDTKTVTEKSSFFGTDSNPVKPWMKKADMKKAEPSVPVPADVKAAGTKTADTNVTDTEMDVTKSAGFNPAVFAAAGAGILFAAIAIWLRCRKTKG